MVCAPPPSDEVVNVAVPPESVTGAPSGAAPSLNCTVPVRGPAPGNGATVAVNVTDWLTFVVELEALSAVVVLALATVTVAGCCELDAL